MLGPSQFSLLESQLDQKDLKKSELILSALMG